MCQVKSTILFHFISPSCSFQLSGEFGGKSLTKVFHVQKLRRDGEETGEIMFIRITSGERDHSGFLRLRFSSIHAASLSSSQKIGRIGKYHAITIVETILIWTKTTAKTTRQTKTKVIRLHIRKNNSSCGVLAIETL